MIEKLVCIIPADCAEPKSRGPLKSGLRVRGISYAIEIVGDGPYERLNEFAYMK
jgi:hypothetical protein